MATWFTIYCTRSVYHVTASDFVSALSAVDFYTVAEGFDIDDEEVIGKALSQLDVKPTLDRDIRFEVCYRLSKLRPLRVHMWTLRDRVQQELAEAREEYLTGRTGPGVSQVCSKLSEVIEIAAVELGISQLEDMGLVIASQIAEYLARVGAGIIRDPGNEWWAIQRSVPKLLLGRA